MERQFLNFVNTLLQSNAATSLLAHFNSLQNWMIDGQELLEIEEESTPTIAQVKAKIDAAVTTTRTQYPAIWSSISAAGAGGSAADSVVAFLTWEDLDGKLTLLRETYFELDPFPEPEEPEEPPEEPDPE
jgi:hypothetical protein